MALVKISELSSASTPLAGTELIELVQSGSSVQAAISDLSLGALNLPKSVVRDFDDFFHTNLASTSNATAIIGVPWRIETNADTATIAALAAEAGRPGIIRFSTPSSNNRRVEGRRALSLATGRWKFSDVQRNVWHARMSRTTECGFKLGLFTDNGYTVATPAGTGAFFQMDTSNDGANVFAVTVVAGTDEVTDLGTAASLGITSFHEWSIERDSGNILFKIDGSTVATHTTTIPGASDAAVTPAFNVLNRIGTTFNLDLDYYETESIVLSR